MDHEIHKLISNWNMYINSFVCQYYKTDTSEEKVSSWDACL